MEEEKRFTGYIYKISSPHTDKIYVGSTIRTLEQRFSGHNSHYRQYLEGKKQNFITSFIILEYGDTVIAELEKLENVTLEELHFREAYLIRNTENTVNKHIPCRTQKQHYEENIIHFTDYKQQYYANNKAKIDERARAYYERNKELLKQKTICECGGSFSVVSKNRHCKSKKHLDYITSLTPPIINITIQNLTINNK